MTSEEADQLKKQNAQLLRALMRVKAERDALAQQIAASRSDEKQTEAEAR